ncbi:MAG: hypothetical protein H0U52_06695 [Chloroflexi bacterium]|nr:hypothetical protein [Chloroflexota bacterium]
MTEAFAPDPEVVADLQLRARTERDRSRFQGEPRWAPPRFVAAWKCRTCGVLVDVTVDALERLAVFNSILRRRNEAPLDHNAIVFCDDCLPQFKAFAADHARGKTDRLAEEIRKLKNSGDPVSEHAVIKTLRDLGHPDVGGLLACLAAKGPTKKTRKQDGM